MLTFHLVQSGPEYVMDEIYFINEEGVIMYLSAKGVTTDNIMKALEGLVRSGEYTLEHE